MSIAESKLLFRISSLTFPFCTQEPLRADGMKVFACPTAKQPFSGSSTLFLKLAPLFRVLLNLLSQCDVSSTSIALLGAQGLHLRRHQLECILYLCYRLCYSSQKQASLHLHSQLNWQSAEQGFFAKRGCALLSLFSKILLR